MNQNSNKKETKLSWIPCSERLPDEDGEYTVTVYRKFDSEPFIDELEEFKDGNWEYYSKDVVLAWMPRIQPYQPPPDHRPIDPLMGWIPLAWREAPIPYNKLVRILYLLNDILVSLIGFRSGKDGGYYVYFNFNYPTEIEDGSKNVIAWKYFDNDVLPPLEAFRGKK